MHSNIGVALKPNFVSSCSRVLYFLKYAFLLITIIIYNLNNKSMKIFAFDIFCLKCCLHTYICYDNAVKDDISSKTV